MFYQNFRWVPQAPNKVSKISNSNIPYSKTKSSVAAAEAKLLLVPRMGHSKATPSGMKSFAFRTNKVQNL